MSKRRSKLGWVIRLFVLLLLGGGGTAAWQYELVPRERVVSLLERIGIIKGAPPQNTHPAETPTVAAPPSEPAVDPSASKPIASSPDPALQTPPPTSAADWYEKTTPTLAAAPPEHAHPPQSTAPSAAVAAQALAPKGAVPPGNNPFESVPPATAIGAPADAASAAAPQPQPASPDVIHPAEFDPAKPAGDDVLTAATASTAGPGGADPRLEVIDQLVAAGEMLQAHRELSTMYWSEDSVRDAIGDRIETTARSIYFEAQPHYMDPYVIQAGDQLRRIAERYNVTWEYLAKLNQTDPRRIRPEQRLKVIKGPFAALIDLSEFELTIHAHGYYVRRYRIGVGKDNSSPVGTFVVQNKVVNPQYTDPQGKVFSSDDPTNPLGERWIDLGHSYGIHGTLEPESIGQAKSRGCIRMLNEDVEEVFDLLVQGSQVVIRR